MLKNLWTAVKDWSWWLLWGALWTSYLTYFIRVEWRKEYLDHKPASHYLIFVFFVWIFITVVFVRPSCLKRDKEKNDED
jgi:hypothetical protein